MSIKAVYASGTLAIYITKGDMDVLCHGKTLEVPLFLNKTQVTKWGIHVALTLVGAQYLLPARQAEKELIRTGKLKWKEGQLVSSDESEEG